VSFADPLGAEDALSRLARAGLAAGRAATNLACHMISDHMDDLALQATQAMLPFLGAGVGAAAHGFAEQLGATLSDKTLSIVEHVQQRLEKSDPSEPAVLEVLRRALRENEIAETDLHSLVAELASQARVQVGTQTAGRDIHNNSIIGEINN
jgi:hypothetical protein